MSTQIPPYQDEHSTQRFGHQSSTSGGGWPSPSASSRRGGKPFFLTSEFLVLLAAVIAIVIAAAVADNFTSPQAWALVTLLAGAYILSRGLSKIGSASRDHS